MGFNGDDSSNFESQIGTRGNTDKSSEDGFQDLSKVQLMTSVRARVVVCKVSKFYASSEKVLINRLDIKPLAEKKLNKPQAPNQPVHKRLSGFTRPQFERRKELMKHRTFSNPLDYSSEFRKSLSSGSESSELKPNNRTQFFASLLEGDTQDQYETKKINHPQSLFEAEPEILENFVQKPLYLRVGKVIRNNLKYLRSKSLQSFSAKLRLTTSI